MAACSMKDVIRQLFDWWATVFLDLVKRDYAGRLPKVKEEKELIGSLDLVLFDRQAPGFRPNDNKPNFLLVCMRKPRNTTIRTEFVNITQADNHEAFANRLTRQHGGVDNIRTRLLHLL
jgi:hypothetical protein